MSKPMLFYSQVEGLSRTKDNKRCFTAISDYSFAGTSHLLPLSGVEFAQAARDYPIVFVGEKDGYHPAALLGLDAGYNEFVDENRSWRPNTYIPAIVRRYPFVLAETGNNSEDLVVCFDPTYSGWGSDGQTLFDEAGNNSQFLNDTLRFLNTFTAEMERTADFVGGLVKHKLLCERDITVQSSKGNIFHVKKVFIVDEDALRNLSERAIKYFNRSGLMGWIYAHLVSLGNLPKLLELKLERESSVQTAVSKAV
ncbi:SapC family protein [Agrobacterium tumefaciens]|uniref:SapC family protein n=1 Tax=Agrobacterium tumefaciens TaxID=358 RepID=UPI001572298E|nr:SapC family protein [Agrobacterium tumefaciens]NSZ72077.1 SapC family protein [Agrobacterium tumefaciens]